MATDNQGTGSTEEQKAFLRELTDAKPRWLEDGLGIRGAARQEFAQQMRSDWPEPTINFKPAERPPRTAPVPLVKPVIPTDVAVTRLPFEVYKSKDNSEPPYPILKIFPGTISNIMATLEGVRLDKPDDEAGDHPWFYPPETDFSFFVRCHVDVFDPGEAFRVGVTTVEVVTDDDEDVAGDIDPETGEVAELQMFWEGASDEEKAERLKGHFYIKIADLDMDKDDEGNIIVVSIEQKLFTNYLSFAVAGDEVIVLM